MPFAALFAGFYTWLVSTLGARLALVVFAAGTVISVTLALTVIIKALIAGLVASMFVGLPASLVMAINVVLPLNVSYAIAAMLSADAAVFACKYHLNLVKMMAG
ncbi:MAG: DUF5455 family protein [Gallionella sp.]|nr:DUF5455 family protein [Gallionella sp.]